MEEQKHDDQEFELVPLSPLRRMEKRIDDIEKKSGFSGTEIYKEIVDIVRMNQQLVDELARSNDALRIELARLPSRLEDLTKKLDELVTFIRASAGEENMMGGMTTTSSADVKPLWDKVNELVDLNKKIVETNQLLSNTVDELNRKMKRNEPSPPQLRRPLLPNRTI